MTPACYSPRKYGYVRAQLPVAVYASPGGPGGAGPVEVTPAQLIVLLRDGTAPLQVRAAVAKGALPLPGAMLIESLELLTEDPDAAVAGSARDSLERLPPSVVRGVASAPATPPELLERILRRFAGNEAVALAVAGNPSAPDAAFVFAAGLALPEVLEVVGRNQDRLESCPEAVAALLANPETPTRIVALWQEAEGRQASSAAGVDTGVTGGTVGGPGAAGEEAEPVFEQVLVEEHEGGPGDGEDG